MGTPSSLIWSDSVNQLARFVATMGVFAPCTDSVIPVGLTSGALALLEACLSHGVSAIMTDVAGRRDVLHMRMTSPVRPAIRR